MVKYDLHKFYFTNGVANTWNSVSVSLCQLTLWADSKAVLINNDYGVIKILFIILVHKFKEPTVKVECRLIFKRLTLL